MRRCGSEGAQWIVCDNKFFGVILAADYCAEHEWGIKDLKQEFGIPTPDVKEPPFGIERMAATQVPRHIFFDKTRLIVDQYGDNYSPSELRLYRDETIAGAWNGRSFGLLVKNKDNIKYLTELHDHIQNKNVFIYLGKPHGGNPFLRAGLIIGITDRATQEAKDMWFNEDKEMAQIYIEAEETGIEKLICEKLKSSYGGKPFFALTPRRKSSNINTKYDVMFWLNPCDQNKNNFGWFTVEELEQWTRGEGPVIIKN